MKSTMKKLGLLVATVVMMLLFAVSASALDPTGQCGDNVYWNFNEETGELVISGEGDMWDYNHNSALFYENTDVKTVVIGNGITSIGNGAFYYCTGLKNIEISESVTSIGEYAFYYCTNLTSITIPNSVTNIGICAFENCEKLISITLPESIKIIDWYIFRNCISLSNVIIPESVTYIGGEAFRNCTSLSNINVPGSVTSIGDRAFYMCTNLTSILIPESVTNIGNRTFGDCTSLLSIVVEEENNCYSSDEYGVLFNKEKTQIMQYPEGSSIIEYTIPSSVMSIEDYAFFNCKNIASVLIPDKVESIGDYAFYNCEKITNIVIPKETKDIGDYAFYNCTGITSITISNIVSKIGNSVFQNCKNLRNVIIGNNVTIIGERAFFNCINLTSIEIPESVKKIERQAFYDCTSLTNIIIPKSVINIGQSAFRNCNIKHIGYIGTEAQWDNITIDDMNSELISSTYLHFNFNPETDIKEIITPSTCHSEGTKSVVCSCGYIYSTEILSIVYCSFTVYKSDSNATCIEDGTKTAHCDYGCGASDTVTDIGSVLGHNMGEYVVTVAPTCVTAGKERADCSRCDYFEIREINAGNHKDENHDGYCDYCNEFIADKNCDCICHAKGIWAFIYKLFRFIDRVFGTKIAFTVFGITDICSCGIVHY